MTYVPVDVPAFGGLDLRDPEDATGSPDLLNVRFNKQAGVLDRKPGTTLIGSLDHYYPNAMYWSEATSRLFVAGAGTGLSSNYIRAETLAGSSTAVTTSYGAGPVPWSIVDAYGGSSPTPAVYFANGTDYLVRYRSGTLTTLSASCSTKTSAETSFSAYSRAAPKPRALCVQMPDKRLVAAGVAAGPNGATPGHSSVVYFSQPDDGEKWDETDYVDLGYDGQGITAAVSWGSLVFVFKKTRLFVFYGNSTDADGGTVFNYRTIDNAFPGNDSDIMVGQICVAPDGLYIWTASGVFFTNGGTPRLVSEPIQRMFNSTVSGYSPTANNFATVGNGTGFALYNKGTMYWTGIGASGVYWYTLTDGNWSRWNANGYGLATNSDTLYTAGLTGIYSMSDSVTTINGTAFSSYYTSPYSTLGSPGVEKTIRQTAFHGSGTIDVSWGKDLQSHGYARSVTMLNGRGLDRTAVRGETLSWKVSGTGAWSLNRVIPHVREQRASGVKT